MAAVQMNMRIDATLKAAGDLAIREGGSSPTRIVRSVWEYAARNRHKPQAVQELLDFLEGTPTCEASRVTEDVIIEQVMRGPHIIEEFYRERGIDPSAAPETSYEDLKAAAFDDEFAESVIA